MPPPTAANKVIIIGSNNYLGPKNYSTSSMDVSVLSLYSVGTHAKLKIPPEGQETPINNIVSVSGAAP